MHHYTSYNRCSHSRHPKRPRYEGWPAFRRTLLLSWAFRYWSCYLSTLHRRRRHRHRHRRRHRRRRTKRYRSKLPKNLTPIRCITWWWENFSLTLRSMSVVTQRRVRRHGDSSLKLKANGVDRYRELQNIGRVSTADTGQIIVLEADIGTT